MQQEDTVGRINDQLTARAAGWHARLRAPDCSAAERREFDAWLAADDRHRRAFDAVSHAATAVTLALRQDPRLRALLESPPLPARATPTPRRVARRRLAVAAGLAALIGSAVLSLPSMTHRDADTGLLASYDNPGSREKAITLQDGSVLHLDAGAQVTAEMGPEARRLALVKGRTYFEVAHDAARPFSVDAAGTRTVALGTKFEVKLASDGVAVTLAEGSVAIATTRASGGWRRTLSPGQQLQLDGGDGGVSVRDVDAAQVTAWSRGWLVFDGEPLASVLDQVNRYSSIKVVLGDERLAAIPIGGTFAAGGDAGAFVQALSAILPVRSEPSGDREIVLFRREPAAATH